MGSVRRVSVPSQAVTATIGVNSDQIQCADLWLQECGPLGSGLAQGGNLLQLSFRSKLHWQW